MMRGKFASLWWPVVTHGNCGKEAACDTISGLASFIRPPPKSTVVVEINGQLNVAQIHHCQSHPGQGAPIRISIMYMYLS